MQIARLDPALGGVEQQIVPVEVDPDRRDLRRAVGVERGQRGQDRSGDELASFGGEDVGHGWCLLLVMFSL